MICPNCGRKNQEHSIFCSHCGYKLAGGKKEVKPREESPDLASSQPLDSSQPSEEGSQKKEVDSAGSKQAGQPDQSPSQEPDFDQEEEEKANKEPPAEDESPAPKSGAAESSDETMKIPVISEEMIQEEMIKKKNLDQETYWEEDQEKVKKEESSQDSSESEAGDPDQDQEKGQDQDQEGQGAQSSFKAFAMKLQTGWKRFVHWLKELGKTWTEAEFTDDLEPEDQEKAGDETEQDLESQAGGDQAVGWKAWFSLDMIIELAVLVFCLLIVFIDLPRRMKPGYQAEAFFNKLANGKLEKAYDYMEGDLDRFDPQSLSILAENYDLHKLSQASLKMGEEKDGQVPGQVIYRVGKEEKTRSFPIIMKKLEGHKHLFFENWKVSPAPYLIDHYRVRVPEGFKVKWDGKDLTADDLDPEGDQDPANEGKDLYLLKGVISGKHTVEASSDFYQTQRIYPQVEGEDMVDVTVQPEEFKDEVFQGMTDQAASNVQRIFTGALAREPFENLAWLFHSSSESQEEAENAYGQLVDWMDENRVIKLDISSVDTQFNREEGSGSGLFPVHIHFEGEASLDNPIFLSLLHREKEFPLDHNYVINYILEGGEWKQFGMVSNFKGL